MTRLARSGISLLPTLLALAALPVAALFVWRVAGDEATDAPAPGDLQVALVRAGLDAEALAAAGVTSQETSDLVGSFAIAMATESGRLADADAAFAAARTSADALQRKVRSGLASAEEVLELVTAKSTLASTEAERADTLNDWFAAGVSELSGTKVKALSTIRSNRHWKLPIEFLVVDREEAEWVALRKALANERICAKYEDPPDVAQQAALTTWRAAPACAEAKVSCVATAEAVKSAWSAATSE